MACVSREPSLYKPMRPSQILKSEKVVPEAIRVIEDDFINPFGLGYDGLHNISSGTSVETELASSILQVHDNGVEQARSSFNLEFTDL